MGYNTFLKAHEWLLGAERVDHMLLKLDKDGNISHGDAEDDEEIVVADLAPRRRGSEGGESDGGEGVFSHFICTCGHGHPTSVFVRSLSGVIR